MDATTNALLIDGDAPLTLPDFARIGSDDFRPAIDRGMQLHRDELAALAAQTAAPDFANTVAAFDRCGQLLSRVLGVFHNLAASATSPALQAVQRALAGPLAAHFSAVYQDAALFHGITNYDEAYGDVPTGASVGEALAKELGSAQVLMMASHGPLIASETIARAFALLYYLDRIVGLQVRAMATGLPLQCLTPAQAAKMAPLIQSIYLGREAELHFNARKRLLDRAGEDYAR